ncbi:MAG: Bug family tripartite tricarboxylate transporter substrate binding protein [Casimicrobium sp.]
MKRRDFLIASTAASGYVLLPQMAFAQQWPSDTTKLIVPFAAGGGTDRLARLVAQRLGEKTGKTFVIENKPGAGGNIGAAQVAKSLNASELLFTTAAIAVSPYLFQNPGYALARDLVPVVQVSSSPLVLVVKSDSPVKSVADLKALADKKSQGLSYASPGIGTTSHLGGFLLAEQLKTKATHIAYRGAGPAVNALLANEIDFALMAAVAVTQFVKSQQLRAIAIAGKTALPDVGNAVLLGNQTPSLEMDNWQGVFASSKVAAATLTKINAAFNEVLKLPDVRASVNADGATPVGGSASAFKSLLDADGKRFGDIVKAAGIKPE